MKLSLVQTDICWADKAANLQNVEKKIAALAGKTDLVLLPEMFSTGFCPDRRDLAETMDGNTVETLRRWATSFGFAVAGSFLAADEGHFFNRAFFVLPEGEMLFADKRHCFSLAKENQMITAGNKRLTVNYKNVNICLLVCYDVRFPVWARNTENAYDLLLFVANFPDRRIAAWDALLPARAIENQAFVAGVNRVGIDGGGVGHSGHSVLLNYEGEKIVEFEKGENTVKTAEIDVEKLKHYREKFPFWADADRFEVLSV